MQNRPFNNHSKLFDTLKERITQYLKNDNPSDLETFFSASGRTGRERAKIYLAVLTTLCKPEDEQALFQKVYRDVTMPLPTGNLQTSSKLRMRLMRGLCLAADITDKTMDDALYASAHDFNVTMSCFPQAGPMAGVMVNKWNQLGVLNTLLIGTAYFKRMSWVAPTPEMNYTFSQKRY